MTALENILEEEEVETTTNEDSCDQESQNNDFSLGTDFHPSIILAGDKVMN